VGFAQRIAGVLLVDKVDAARQQGTSIATPNDVEEWATRQAGLDLSSDPEELQRIAAMVLSLGGDPGSLVLAVSAEGPLERREIVPWAAERDEIWILDVRDTVMDARDVQAIPPDPTIHLGNDVLDVKTMTGSMPSGLAGSSRRSLIAEVTELVAQAWDCEVGELEEWEVDRDDLFEVDDAEPVLAYATLLVRPGSTITL
jgi:hypothetical protein